MLICLCLIEKWCVLVSDLSGERMADELALRGGSLVFDVEPRLNTPSNAEAYGSVLLYVHRNRKVH